MSWTNHDFNFAFIRMHSNQPCTDRWLGRMTSVPALLWSSSIPVCANVCACGVSRMPSATPRTGHMLDCGVRTACHFNAAAVCLVATSAAANVAKRTNETCYLSLEFDFVKDTRVGILAAFSGLPATKTCCRFVCMQLVAVSGKFDSNLCPFRIDMLIVGAMCPLSVRQV